MLSAMSYWRSRYDYLARTRSLNFAICYAAGGSFSCCLGLAELLKYFKEHDSFYLYAGPAWMVLGCLSALHGVLLIHAVVRRLVREGREPGSDESSPSGSHAPEAGLN
jgi:hypothetical protein